MNTHVFVMMLDMRAGGIVSSSDPGIIVYARASQSSTEQARMSAVSQGSARTSGAGTTYSR